MKKLKNSFIDINALKYPQMLIYLILAQFSGILSYYLIEFFKKRMTIFGKDLHKKGDIFLPEAMGISTGLAFIMTIFTYIIYLKLNGNLGYISLLNYIAITSSCMFTILLGFLDDLFNLEWWFKIIFPAFSIIPCILLYDGKTTAIIPLFGLIDLGIFYFFYMVIFAIFSTNCINILSGINGLEVLQVLIASGFLFIDNILSISKSNKSIILENKNERYEFGAMICLILFFTSLPLYFYNKFPAKVLVGDTFCYFSGMSLSCVAIICHTTRTLFFLLSIQVLNFIISAPQIFRIFPCPRHRLPGYNDKFLVPSTFLWKDKKLINFTILNIILKFTQNVGEEDLCWFIGYIMIFCGIIVTVIKH